jgi:hypothetical protein
VTGDARFENFLATCSGVCFAKAASGEAKSPDREKQGPNRELISHEGLNSAHVQSQGTSQGADTSSRQNRTQAELALIAGLISAI